MTLQLGVIPATGWSALRPLWQALGWNEQDFPAAESWYLQPNAPVGASVLLVHARAETIIARLMQEGMPPSQALMTWQGQAEAMLECFKTHRRKACMIDIQCLTSPQAVDSLCQYTGLSLSMSLPRWQTAELPAEEYLLIATQLLCQRPEVAPLLAQLEACTLPLSDACLQPPEIDLPLVLQRLISNQEQNQQLVDAHEQAKRQLASLTKHSQLSAAELTEQREVNRLLLAQLQSVQEAFETQMAEKQPLEERLQEQQAQNRALTRAKQKAQHLRNKLNRLNSRITRKMGATIRALGKPLRRKPADKRRLKRQAR
ncbi:hypothetical protein [Pistricoccus aurantiacus]|uniref:hypothetical protein n=1 Tax=Pistricoccus aurantiacus TaxID=1883414 RepID=UPI00362A3AF7